MTQASPHGRRLSLLCLGVICLAVLLFPGSTDALAAAGDGSSGRALVERALDDLAVGRDARHIGIVKYDVQSITYDLAENDHSDAPFPVQGFAAGSEFDDYRSHRQFVTESGSDRITLTDLVSEAAGRADGGNIRLTGSVPAAPAWRALDPLHALLAARASADLRREPDMIRHGALQHVVSFHLGRFPVRLFIDERLGLPTSSEALIAIDDGAAGSVAWNGRGDVLQRAEFMIYDLKVGLRLPTQIDIYRDGEHWRTISRRSFRVDDPADLTMMSKLPAPPPPKITRMADVRIGQIVGPDPKRGTSEIAPGVVQLAGSWYVTLVRQSNGVVVLDAPISPGYSRQVIAESRRRFPGLPIKAVVTSTAFAWHIGGLREYAARGIPIYLRDRNVPIVRKMLGTSYTLASDAGPKRSAQPILRAVSRQTTLGRGTNAITLIPIRYGEQPMLMSWIKDASLLHTAEMVQPLGPNGSLLFPEALLEITRSVEEAGIPTANLKVIGMHMSPTAWTEIDKALAAALPRVPGATSINLIDDAQRGVANPTRVAPGKDDGDGSSRAITSSSQRFR